MCGYKAPTTEKLCGRKKARSTATPAVERAQAIARSRLHDYPSTPLVRLKPSATTTNTSWTVDCNYQGTGATSDGRPTDRLTACYEKKLLIPPPGFGEKKKQAGRPVTSECNVYLSDYKFV